MSREGGVPLLEVGSPDAPPGSRSWALWHRAVIIDLLYDSKGDAERLRGHLDAMKAHEGWRHLQDGDGKPFRTYREFCCAPQPFGLGYDPDDLERLWRERLNAQARAEEAKEAKGHGGDRRSKKFQPVAHRLKWGTGDADYMMALLKRDHPEVYERALAGEFKTTAQAARAAGIHKRYPKVTPTPEGFERAIRRHLSSDQIDELLALLGEVG